MKTKKTQSARSSCAAKQDILLRAFHAFAKRHKLKDARLTIDADESQLVHCEGQTWRHEVTSKWVKLEGQS